MTKKADAATEAQVAALWKEGLTIKGIAGRVGISRPTVKRIVDEGIAAGVLEPREERGAPPYEEVAALRRQGLTGDDIAEKLGVARPTAYKWIKHLQDTGVIERVSFAYEYIAQEKAASPDTPPIVRVLLENRMSGEPLKALTVLSDKNDPYRIDSPAAAAAGRWLADEIARLDADPLVRREQWWNRGLHYALLGRRKPDGTVYVNDAKNWRWLDAVASRAARWGGLVPFDRIIDRKNNAPTIRLAEEVGPEPQLSHYLDDIDLMPRVWLADFNTAHPYRIALVAEKSSAADLLEPLSRRYNTDLYAPDGEMTDTMIHRMAQAADADGRPLVVIYFSDCDPSGYQMPISVARKLQAFRDFEFPYLDFRVVQAAMLPEQIIEHKLPSSPLKDKEKRAGAWREAFGVEQTELDSLTSLRPDLFEEIAVEAIERFYDTDLEREVRLIREEWEEQAQAAVDALADSGEQARLRAEAEAAIEALRVQIEADFDRVELPDIPEVPESDLDPGEVPNTVIDSADDWRTQTRKLIDRKRYVSEDD